jgi:hypothetical protein
MADTPIETVNSKEKIDSKIWSNEEKGAPSFAKDFYHPSVLFLSKVLELSAQGIGIS